MNRCEFGSYGQDGACGDQAVVVGQMVYLGSALPDGRRRLLCTEHVGLMARHVHKDERFIVEGVPCDGCRGDRQEYSCDER